MEPNFARCMAFVFEREGGYVDDPDDPGGATNLGITFATLKAWRHGAVTKADVRSLTKAEATRIYHANYWLPALCDRLPGGIDLPVFDAAVNMGVEPSLNLLRAQIGQAPRPRNAHHVFPRVEAHLRPVAEQHLLQGVANACMPSLIEGVCSRRRDFYHSLGTFKHFGKGWLHRVTLVQAAAMRVWAVSGTAIP